MNYIYMYFSSAALFAVIDLVWITYVVTPMYRANLGAILAEKFAAAPAIAFYLLYILGMMYFAVVPGMQAGSWKLAAMHGAMFGFMTYATYCLTNMAIMKVWPLSITIADIAWGAFITALVSGIIVYMFR
jgi:uncharacterized membrane protein